MHGCSVRLSSSDSVKHSGLLDHADHADRVFVYRRSGLLQCWRGCAAWNSRAQRECCLALVLAHKKIDALKHELNSLLVGDLVPFAMRGVIAQPTPGQNIFRVLL